MIVPLLWAAFGMTIGAAVLHAAIGLPRPRDRTHVLFAGIMLTVSAYTFFETRLFQVTNANVVETVRTQVVVAHVVIAFVLAFVPAYTHVRIPRWLAAGFAAGLFGLFVANLVAPYGIWFSAEPQLVVRDDYVIIVDPPPVATQFVHAFYVLGVFALTFTCALMQIRRGERRRGSMLAAALVIAILQHVVDLIRTAVGGTWPYTDVIGLVAWGLIMSVQLAIEYRTATEQLRMTLARSEEHAAELARTAEAALHVRDKLNTPLQTLELSLEARTPTTNEGRDALVELRGAVTEISESSRAVEQSSDYTSALAALERAS